MCSAYLNVLLTYCSTDANFQCGEDAIELQAMDNSHVALVAVKLGNDGFSSYRCDRPVTLGVNLNSLTKVLKCAKDNDIVTLKASDDGDILNLTYEGARSDRIAEYDMKLMDIDADQLGIPDTDYDAKVTMPSNELSRIVRDLAQLGESVRIEVSKEGVRFAAEGETANGSVLLKQTDAARRKYSDYGKDVKKEPGTSNDDDDEEQEEGSSKRKANGSKVKKEQNEDTEMEDAENLDPDVDEDGEDEKPVDSDAEEEAERAEKRKRKKAQVLLRYILSRSLLKSFQAGGKAKKMKKSDDDEGADGVAIDMSQHVSLTFSLKYLVNFSKSASLSDTVLLHMSNDVPLLV